MPHLRRGTVIPGGHWIDTVGDERGILVFLDAVRVHETLIAHEIGHAWVQYVEQAEDERVLEDVSDPQRLHQLAFVQSFVLDLRVNDVLREKGFDVSLVEADQAASIESMGRAI